MSRLVTSNGAAFLATRSPCGKAKVVERSVERKKIFGSNHCYGFPREGRDEGEGW